jgi:hypothetical protein
MWWKKVEFQKSVSHNWRWTLWTFSLILSRPKFGNHASEGLCSYYYIPFYCGINSPYVDLAVHFSFSLYVRPMEYHETAINTTVYYKNSISFYVKLLHVSAPKDHHQAQMCNRSVMNTIFEEVKLFCKLFIKTIKFCPLYYSKKLNISFLLFSCIMFGYIIFIQFFFLNKNMNVDFAQLFINLWFTWY